MNSLATSGLSKENESLGYLSLRQLIFDASMVFAS